MNLENCRMEEFFRGREEMQEHPVVQDLLTIFRAKLKIADKYRAKFVELEDHVIETCFNSQKFCEQGDNLDRVVTRLLDWIEKNA